MTPLLQVILTFVIGLLTVSGTYATIRVSRPKMKAESDSVITQTALSLLAPLRERISSLETEHAAFKADLLMVREENRLLRIWGKANYRRVEELGGVPVPFEDIYITFGVPDVSRPEPDPSK